MISTVIGDLNDLLSDTESLECQAYQLHPRATASMNGASMSDVEPDELVLSLEHGVWQAVVRKDQAALDGLFADDYIEITLEGKRIEKTEVVKQSPLVDEIERYSIGLEKVVWLGQDSAVLTYHLTLDGRCRGATISPRDRWASSVWSRRDGNWLCHFFQQSTFAEEHGSTGLTSS